MIFQKLRTFSFLVALLCCMAFTANATHIIGGEFIYDCLGTDTAGNYTYVLTLKVYRDCSNPNNAAYDNPAFITIWDGAGIPGVVSNISIPFPGAIQLPFVSSDPCFIPPSGVCVEEAIYTDTVVVPPSATGYIFAYQRCCRNNSIINIVNPGSTGATYFESVPDTILCNSSPRFTNFPPIALCVNRPLVFDHSATDPDGDSLVYYICSPYEGADNINSMPTVTSSPPFTPLTFLGPGYTAGNPITGSPALAIDPVTGILTVTPTQLGQFVVGVCCDEYRNGVLIGTHHRDFQFNVTNCDQITPVEISSGSIINGVLSTDSLFTEGCELGLFVIHRDSINTTDTLHIVKGGNAIEGLDYDSIPDIIIIGTGVANDTIVVTANSDGLAEGTDTLILSLTYVGLCGVTYAYDTIYIQDYVPINISITGDTTLCPWGPPPVLDPVVTGGYGDYHYTWYPTLDTTDTILAYVQQTTEFYVEVGDECNHSVTSSHVTVTVQCPIVIPDVISANNDGMNDIFFIKNIEQYPDNEVWFFNRWGILLHYERNYANNWKPEVVDGVYFYVVNDKVHQPYHGFFSVFGNP